MKRLLWIATLLISFTGAAQSMPKSAMTPLDTAIGCRVYVNPAYVQKFSHFFQSLHDHGYRPPCSVVNCWARPGTHVPGSNHYNGAACDIQTGKNRGPSFIFHMEGIIRGAGLHSGCRFRDCGHVEAVTGTHNGPPNVLTAIRNWDVEAATLR